MDNVIGGLVIIVIIFAIIGGGFLLFSSDDVISEQTVEQKEQEVVSENLEEMQRQIGQPAIDEFFEKKMFKKIMELRDNSELICYAYTVNLEGKLIYQGTTIGYGLPYSIQYTSPQKYVDEDDIDGGRGFDHGSGWGDLVMPQAEPNGLYMPEGLSATWLIMVDEETGETRPAYYEPNIVVRQEKAPRRLCAEWSLPDDY